MLNNPIVRREFLGTLRRPRAMLAINAVAIAFVALVALRWPTDAKVDLSGAQSQEVFRLFGYGLLTALLLLAPAFPATSMVREKRQGTLALLLNSPLTPWSIYAGKLVGCLGFVLLLLITSLPSAAACYALGGLSLTRDILALYAVLLLLAWEYTALGLLVSSYANQAESALRITYGCVLLLSVVSLGPHFFFQGTGGMKAVYAEQLRCLSPVPAVMEVLNQGDLGSRGILAAEAVAPRFLAYGALATALFMAGTLRRLNYGMFDRPRSQGVMTDERPVLARLARRLFFVVDPQRRKPAIAPLVNPVMVKEFRCRRFGRMHWMLRLAAASALVSLGLTFLATMGTLDWGPETVGGIMVLLQAALLVLLIPSLAAGLISADVESGGWQLLQMTPLPVWRIISGKLASVLWPVLLILVSTIPGYLVMIYIQPDMWLEIRQVLICLSLTGVFSLALSFAVSSVFHRTAVSTAVSYSLLAIICAGTLLVWLLEGAPFGRAAVQYALTINPIAAALSTIGTPGFADYMLIPANWWFLGGGTCVCALVVLIQTRRLSRPR
jgi:ABC-type transport system involved in multi-copper enzyme maturation permease subunit